MNFIMDSSSDCVTISMGLCMKPDWLSFYIIRSDFSFLEILYFLTWALNGIYTSKTDFNAVLHACS